MPGQVTVQGDAKVTLYVTGLDGTAVNLVARTDGLALPRNGLKHFLSLKARPEAADHEDKLSRSCWRAAPSSSDITTWYTLGSSAKKEGCSHITRREQVRVLNPEGLQR